MKPYYLLAAFGLGVLTLSAEPSKLTEPERETLLDSLEKLRSDANTEVESKYRAAVAAFQGALDSDQAAIDLYEKCVELVEFTQRDRSTKDFREWKKRNAERMDAPGFGLALRYQLRWLLLTIYAATEQDRELLAPKAAEILSSMFQSAESLKGQQGTLRQNVLSTPFAQAYELGGLEVENWVGSPLQLGDVYEKIILPPLRRPDSTDKLRNAWTNRILYEARIIDGMHQENGNRNGNNQENRIQDFQTIIRPDLIWQMEQDVFKAGDQRGAAKNMLQHLKVYLAHDRARNWEKEFRNLIAPETEAPSVE